MNANDPTDQKFVALQNDLNSTALAPCTRSADASTSCIKIVWNTHGFAYNLDAIKIARQNLCASCMASWLVAVARNLMLGLL